MEHLRISVSEEELKKGTEDDGDEDEVQDEDLAEYSY